MSTTSKGKRRGVALVLVLWLVVILGVIGATVMTGTRTATALASNVRARAVARAAAESGIASTIAAVEDSLRVLSDSAARRNYLNMLPEASRDDSVSLGSGRFIVAITDPGRQLDINAAPAERLAVLFGRFTDISTARTMARLVRAYVERSRSDDPAIPPAAITPGTTHTVHRLRSLDELQAINGLDARVLQLSAPYLTVDGDGTINGATASDTVMAAAFGEVRNEPSQLVVISRGWESENALTHEIQGVYAISNDRLVLVTWRERVR